MATLLLQKAWGLMLFWLQSGLPQIPGIENIPTSAVAVILFVLWRDVNNMKADIAMLKMSAGIANAKKETDG